MALFRILLLLSLFAPIVYRAASDEGPYVDPNGRPLAASSDCGNALDAGSSMDPNG